MELGGQMWRHAEPSRSRPVVVIAPATSVHSRYYHRFADHLFQQGFDVLTFDYRGIGHSRPPSLRGFRADWVTGASRTSMPPYTMPRRSAPASRFMWWPIPSAASPSALPPRARASGALSPWARNMPTGATMTVPRGRE